VPSLTLIGQSLLSGLFIGGLYGLLGLGLSLTWGMLRLINLTFFALAFLGAYLTYQLATISGVDPLLTLALIIPCFFVLGVVLQFALARFGVNEFTSLLVTFGLTVIIESGIQWFWTADFRRLESWRVVDLGDAEDHLTRNSDFNRAPAMAHSADQGVGDRHLKSCSGHAANDANTGLRKERTPDEILM